MRTKGHPSNRKFILTATILIAATSALITGLIFISSFTGPRIRFTELSDSSPALPGQQLLLHANRPLNPDKNRISVTIEPAVDYKVAVQGNSVAVSFARPLNNDTTYTVSLRDLTDSRGKVQASTYTHSFQTKAARYAYLERNPAIEQGQKPADRIITSDLGTDEQQILFEAPRIKAFRVTKDYLVVATTSDKKIDTVQYVPIKNTKQAPQRTELPENIVVNHIETTRSANIIGLSLSTNHNEPYGAVRDDFDNTLVLHNIDTGTLEKVMGLDGQPTTCVDIAFSNYDTSYLYQTAAGGLFLRSASSKDNSVALGQFVSFSNFNRDLSKLLVTRSTGPAILEASTREVTPVPPVVAAAMRVRFMNTSDDFLLTRNRLNDEDLSLNVSLLRIAEDGTETALATRPMKESMLLNPGSSPNDQYVTYEQAPATSVYDGYGNFPHPEQSEILIKTLHNQQTVSSFRGSQLIWL